ncbi:MAG: hypothetical protein Q4G46_03295 [Propionibacteriaceae bacterium]|nr:hypothetical protein [Propionibacteriaceae bacterium]
MTNPRSDWHGVLAFAVTGDWLTLPPAEGEPDLDRLLADLAAVGWSGTRLADAAVPRVMPVESVRELGAARFAAVLSELRRRVRAQGADVRRVSARRLNPDEQRLMADRPPHWG